MNVPVAAGRYMAQQIPGAKYVDLNGRDHLPWVGNAEALISEIRDFLTGGCGTPLSLSECSPRFFSSTWSDPPSGAAAAGPGEVLVSSTVKDLVVGSGLLFQNRGLRRLRGVPSKWRVFAAESAS
jgi:hypothetical protein